MAKLGLKYPVYAAINTETTSAITYTGGAVLAKAISADVKINSNNAKLYADDALAETDKSFSNGTITFGIDDLTDAVKVALLGYVEGTEIDAVTHAKELSAGTGEPAFVGFGFYAKKVKSGTNYWRAIWYRKVQFSDVSESLKTKGENVEFQTPTIEGEILKPLDELYKQEGTFSTESAAIAWLNAKSGISSAVSNNLSALALSNGTLTPTFAAGTYNYSCALTDTPTVITATFAAGTAKVYVDGIYNQALTTTVAGSGIAVADGANKLISIVVQESGKTAVTYNIMAQNAS
jgi:phi13 family phage major tail protein